MRRFFVFLVLASLRLLARCFYRVEVRWIGDPPPDRWKRVRVLCLLHHTSLFEWLYVIAVPASYLWDIAGHGVVPAAEKTLRRPVVGWFFRSLAAHVVSITRERDHTWRTVLSRIEPRSMILILPEGRMMRRNGLDAEGRPMTVRGGVADILEAIGTGRMLIAYSGGLHHVQAPGDRRPKLFKTLRLNLECVEIAEFREERLRETESAAGFKRAVVRELERRRDLHCPTPEGGGMTPRSTDEGTNGPAPASRRARAVGGSAKRDRGPT